MISQPEGSSKFKVLFLYPNFQMAHLLLPASISILSAVLKNAGFDTKVFDTTLYKPKNKSLDEVRLELLQLKRFNLNDKSVIYKETDMMQDWIDVVNEYQPNLIAVSLLEDTFPIAQPLLRQAKDMGYLIVAGGIMASFAPHDVVKEASIDIVCKGEGENAMVELCRALSEGRAINQIPNLWIIQKPQIQRDLDHKNNGVAFKAMKELCQFAEYGIEEARLKLRAIANDKSSPTRQADAQFLLDNHLK